VYAKLDIDDRAALAAILSEALANG
jgi:hypothetical protein